MVRKAKMRSRVRKIKVKAMRRAALKGK